MRRIVIVAAALMAMSAAAGAQEARGSVGGGGMEQFKTLPDEMRMTVMVEVKGKTAEEAIEAYRTRAEAVKKSIADAGAAAETIKTESPRLVDSAQSEQEMMMRRMMQESEGVEGEEKKPEESVKLAFQAAATWPLKATTAEDLIIEALAIRKKIEGMDLEGKAAKTEEELEAMEEAAAEYYGGYRGDEEQAPGKPKFIFVKKIDEAKVAEMKKAAYEKAKENAAKDAALAERKVGQLMGISVGMTSAGMADENAMYGSMYANRYGMMQDMGAQMGKPGEAYAGGREPGEVEITVRVQASYELLPPGA